MSGISVGCDPEVFIQDTRSGDVVPAYGIVPGSKYDPYEEDGTLISVDGVAAEIGIKPAKYCEEFVHNVNSAIALLKRILAPRYKMMISSSQMIKEKYLKEVPEEVLQLGCEPDLDAYTGAVFNVDQVHHRKNSMFYCGGHVHIGWTKEQDTDSPNLIEDCRTLAIVLDYYLGAPMKGISTEIGRSTIYETPGRHRVKPYGMEYRTPSNAWLKENEYKEFVFNAAKSAVTALLKGKSKVNLQDTVGIPDAFTTFPLTPDAIIQSSDTNNGFKLFKLLQEQFRRER